MSVVSISETKRVDIYDVAGARIAPHDAPGRMSFGKLKKRLIALVEIIDLRLPQPVPVALIHNKAPAVDVPLRIGIFVRVPE